MLRETASPSKHNAMLGKKVAHPRSTNYDDAAEFNKRPVKRLRRDVPDDHPSSSPSKSSPRRIDKSAPVADSEDDEELEDLTIAINSATGGRTELESALPPIRTDEEAIEEYEATRAAQMTHEGNAEQRLSTRKWVRGKSSIYVDAFNLALETVLEDESHLFNEAEATIFQDWRQLRYESQYLYVRLFLRKTSSWHRINRLGYHSDIADLPAAISDLQAISPLPASRETEHHAPGDVGAQADLTLGEAYAFADRSEDSITTLEEASSLLLLDELKAIAKEAKVQGKNKSELLRALRRSSSKQSGLGFLRRTDTEESIDSVTSHESGASTPGRGENRDAHFIAKILAETGPCVRLSLPVLKLFERVHLVFYRSTEWTEKSLTAIILARISRWNFPEYLVSRSTNIFPSRAILLEFEASVRTQFRIDNILEFNGPVTTESFQTILDLFEEVYPRWQTLLREEQHKEDSIYTTGEGAYLRRLSPAWVYTRILHKGAFVLGKLKHHLREHSILSELLQQTLFHTARRGDWYQRKALLEEHYMGNLTDSQQRSPEAQKRQWKQIALQTCDTGLQDPLTHLIYHHDLQKRVVKLEKALRVPKRAQHDFGHVRLAKAFERTFSGTQVVRSDQSPGPIGRKGGGKTMWLDPATPEDTENLVSVEAMCLSNYRRHGWRGYHSEGSIVRTLFAALFHDVIFTYVPNVFQTPYQTCPLDLHSDAFFPARISEVNARLNDIGDGLAESIARKFYEEHEERRTCVVGMNWDFGREDILSTLRAWSPSGLATVMKVLAQEYGARGGGVPDLFLWREFDASTLRTIRHVDGSAVGEAEQVVKVETEGDTKLGILGPTLINMDDESETLDEAEKARRSAIIASGRTGEVRFAEVKSENDRLSDTQRMWIDVLTGAGIAVELCHAAAEKVIEV